MCLNNLVSPVRVPVGVFYLNMSKKGKKQDGKYYWNDLSLSIRNKSSKILFKKALILNIFIFKGTILTCVRGCVRACVRVCILMNNKVNLVKEPSLVFYNVPLSILILSLCFFFLHVV